jgi:hypothetical protein
VFTPGAPTRAIVDWVEGELAPASARRS